MNPLDQLRDLHLPPAPGIWPLAPGWWVVTALLFLTLCCAVWFYLKRRQASAYRRAGLEEATILFEKDNVRPIEPFQLVRRIALSGDPTTRLATVSGADLLEMLDNFSDGELVSRLEVKSGETQQTIEAWLYGSDSTALTCEQQEFLYRLIVRWIRGHHREDLC